MDSAQVDPGGGKGTLAETRERIRALREKLVFRCKDLGRWKHFQPASVEVPRDPAKAEAEQALFKIITGCLFDPTTLIPVDVQALHRKVKGSVRRLRVLCFQTCQTVDVAHELERAGHWAC